MSELFLTRKRIVLLHLGGKVIHTTADHPYFVGSQGWVIAAEMPGAKSDGEQEVVYHLNPSTGPASCLPVIDSGACSPGTLVTPNRDRHEFSCHLFRAVCLVLGRGVVPRGNRTHAGG